MSLYYLGEILLVGFDFAPVGFMPCEGQLLPIASYDTLFTLLGTTYGGDGQNTFQLPDLRGRAPIHQGTGLGSNYQLGELGGSESVTLLTTNLPAHTHALVTTGVNPRMKCSPTGGTSRTPGGGVLAREAAGVTYPYSSGAADAAMAAANITASATIQPAGQTLAHNNLQPYLAMRYIICVIGDFPTQS